MTYGAAMAIDNPLDRLRQLNTTAAFNVWCGLSVDAAEPGRVELSLPWRPELGQYIGFMHAGVIGALIDTACGFAAATMLGRVLASHYSINCLRPAVGERFIARGRVVKPGKTQVFTAAELFARTGNHEKLVATGETILTVISTDLGD